LPKTINSLKSILGNINEKLVTLIKFFIAILLSGMSICILLAVVTRYILKVPLTWTEEMARYLMIWLALLSASLGVKRGVHVGIVFLVRRVSKNLQLYLDIVSRILISIFFVFVIYQGFKLSGLVSRQFSPAMRIPMNWVYLSLPISSIISLLFNLDLLIDSIVNIVIKTKS
jgi:TRAP-type C4-dicarboxylate transport system permease small subunit